jgi:SAM-dependent methyltransferase
MGINLFFYKYLNHISKKVDHENLRSGLTLGHLKFGKINNTKFKQGDFADKYIRDLFNLDEIHSLDILDYEGASIIADFGKTLNYNLKNRFDLVLDAGGTIGAIFDIKSAVKNLDFVTKIGGLIVLLLPLNNLNGKIFYQFSLQFIKDVFSSSFLVEDISILMNNRFYKVNLDDLSSGFDIKLGSKPSYILCVLRKIEDSNFEDVNLSFYSQKLNKNKAKSTSKISPFFKTTFRYLPFLPRSLKHFILRKFYYYKYFIEFNPNSVENSLK